MAGIEERFERRRARMCGTKRAFATEQEAEDAAYRHRMETGEAKQAYLCDFCRHWHIGSYGDALRDG
jgi:hypothetical protein